MDPVNVPDSVQHRERLAGRVELDPLMTAWIGNVAQLPVVHSPPTVDEVEGVRAAVRHGPTIAAASDNSVCARVEQRADRRSMIGNADSVSIANPLRRVS